jgi:hypothetical protein
MLPLDDSSSVGQPSQFLQRRDIIATVLEIIRGAWNQVCNHSDVSPNSDEPTIAGALYLEMWQERDRRGINGPPRISNESATRKSQDSLKPDGFIDFQMIYGWGQEEYFGIECKRISSTKEGSDSKLATEYVENGMMRFVNGIYSPKHDFAAMLGFVIDRQINECIDRIKGRLKDRRNKTCLEEDWKEETDFGKHPHLYRTHHRQPDHDNNQITLLHLFVEF